jgi:hypothetical protein
VFVDRGNATVYGLVEHGVVSHKTEREGGISFDIELGSCDGRVYLVTPQPIDAVRIDVPRETQQGTSATCSVEIVDNDGRPVDAVIPLEVEIRDAEGRRAEGSGYYGAAGGRVTIDLEIAPNEPPGNWYIRVRELASNRRAAASLRIRRRDEDAASPAGDRRRPAGIADQVQPRG